MSSIRKIAIIGAGFSGTLVATHLLRQARSPLTIYLIERNPRQFSRGIAYGTSLDGHLLNVPASNMSAFPDDPGHFLRWAEQREQSLLNPPWVTEINPSSFLPRRAYGDYLEWTLDKAERESSRDLRLERRWNEAVEIRVTPWGVDLRLNDGENLQVDQVALALGNFGPADPTVDDPSFYRSARYYGDPWAPDVLPDLLQTRSCLFIGSGLTMVDWAISLSQGGYQGLIYSVSRRGLWPQTHRPYSPTDFPPDPDTPPHSVRTQLHEFRQHLRSSGCDWRAAIDAFRPFSQQRWASLPPVEQKRFLRHIRPYWDCHRHRIAPRIGQQLQILLESGQLVHQIGRIINYRETESGIDVLIRPRGQDHIDTVRVDAVVNCSGSESNYRKLESPLIRNLLEQGLAYPDPQALGFNVAPSGALIGSDGMVSERLFTLGPPKKGMLWETTAVPEIRGQAAQLATRLLTAV
jgi:uncharacterized NAD(P)/FAD-binding protein YdhS